MAESSTPRFIPFLQISGLSNRFAVDFWASRNVIEDNRIVNSGGPDGIAIDIQGKTKVTRIARNMIIESREPMKRIGIRVSS